MIIEVCGCRYFRISSGSTEFLLEFVTKNSLHLDQSMDRTEIEKISKALADETRLRIFEAISATSHMTCSEIVSMRGVTAATVSHHLKILSEAKLIACRRKGQFVYSKAVPETVAAYSRAARKARASVDWWKSVRRISSNEAFTLAISASFLGEAKETLLMRTERAQRHCLVVRHRGLPRCAFRCQLGK